MEGPAVSIIGLGKLGAPIAACFARSAPMVICVDRDQRAVEALNQGQAPVFEPGLDECVERYRGRLRATLDYDEAVPRTDISFITVQTPSDSGGGFSTEYVLDACRSVGASLRKKDGYHLVVLTSTVLPGVTESEVMPVLESSSGKRCGEDFGLCYSPEFIALGSVIHDFLNPDFLLIGESDTRAGDMLRELYERTCDNEPHVARMSFAEAELTKIALNSFITMKITFANTLARMCERLPGANVDVVTSALGHDTRIGGRYLKGAISYGGPCFPRDNSAFAHLAGRLGVPPGLAAATDSENKRQVKYLLGLVKSELVPGGRVGILGLSYKPDTCVVEESPGMLLAGDLLREGFPVSVYDPLGTDNARKELRGEVTFAASVSECVEASDLVVITTPWPEFAKIPPGALKGGNGRKVIIDCWRLLDEKEYGAAARLFSLGNWLGRPREEG